MYDYAIVGAGPAGLTMAYYLAKYNKKVLLIEHAPDVGGCHRVRRVNGLFTEHGPRIILDNYFSFIDILSEMDIKFTDLYVEYRYSTRDLIVGDLLRLLTIRELGWFAYEFIIYIFYANRSKNLTMLEFATKYNFSSKARDYLDMVCRLTDGGDISNYTLFEFFQIPNQTFFYKSYQPRLPNDVGLFAYWKLALAKTGNVDILLNTEIVDIVAGEKIIDYVVAKNNHELIKIYATNYIFAIPPTPMLNIIRNSSTNKNMFGDINKLIKWEKETRYLVYLPINFHWDTHINLKDIPGVTDSDYGIIYIVMSDYMNFNDDRSKTVITCTAKVLDKKSSFNGKTANECSQEELIEEVFRQLKLYQPNIPIPTYSILSPGVYKNGDKWDTSDTAFFSTKAGYVGNKSMYKNLYWVGTHNGNSSFSFTSLESAVENAIVLLRDINPEINIKRHKPYTLKNLIHMILVVLVIILIIYKYNLRKIDKYGK